MSNNKSNQLLEKPQKTFGQGDCFFHAAFGTYDFLSQMYKTNKVKEMRKAWVDFLNQYHSLADVNMPLALKEKLKIVLANFIDDPNRLTGQADLIRELAGKTKNAIAEVEERAKTMKKDLFEMYMRKENKRQELTQLFKNAYEEQGKEPPTEMILLNNHKKLENAIGENIEACINLIRPELTNEEYYYQYTCTHHELQFVSQQNLYQAYLKAISLSGEEGNGYGYFIFTEEISILAALAQKTIICTVKDEGSYIFSPDQNLLPVGYTAEDCWSNILTPKEVKVYLQKDEQHYSHMAASKPNINIQNVTTRPKTNRASISPYNNLQNDIECMRVFRILKNIGQLGRILQGKRHQNIHATQDVWHHHL